MKVIFKANQKILKVSYAKDVVHDLSPEIAENWYVLALLANGQAKEVKETPKTKAEAKAKAAGADLGDKQQRHDHLKGLAAKKAERDAKKAAAAQEKKPAAPKKGAKSPAAAKPEAPQGAQAPAQE